jgi:glycosyltransferase involved in cell wall biosynthesis
VAQERCPTIAYIAQTFPALTQTFVYREVFALQERGFDVVTCAIWRPNKDKLSQESQHLVEDSLYVFPISWLKFLAAHLTAFLARPVKYLGTLFYILTHKGESRENRLRSFYHFFEAVSLAPELRRRRVQHIHAHFTINAATIAWVLSRLLGITFSFTAHNIFFIDRVLLEEKAQDARFIVAISEFTKQFLLRLVPGSGLADKIHVVHCGLSLETFSPPVNKPENEVPVVLFVAQLADRKGAPFLVQACRILKEREVPFHCTIIGGGDVEKQRLEQLIARYGPKERVSLTGALPQEQVKPYFDRADVFVLPCITAQNGDMDGIPVALMEAMAMEIPTVSTYVSGIPELIEHGTSGLLVQEKDAVALADALERLFENEQLRADLGKGGRRKIVREFDLYRNVARLADLFESYLNVDPLGDCSSDGND